MCYQLAWNVYMLCNLGDRIVCYSDQIKISILRDHGPIIGRFCIKLVSQPAGCRGIPSKNLDNMMTSLFELFPQHCPHIPCSNNDYIHAPIPKGYYELIT